MVKLIYEGCEACVDVCFGMADHVTTILHNGEVSVLTARDLLLFIWRFCFFVASRSPTYKGSVIFKVCTSLFSRFLVIHSGGLLDAVLLLCLAFKKFTI